MFRLIMALGVLMMLMPDNLEIQQSKDELSGSETAAKVSTLDTLNAAGSVVEDIAGFCERNVETCETGKAIASNVYIYAKSAVSALSETRAIEKDVPVDDVMTGSIHPDK